MAKRRAQTGPRVSPAARDYQVRYEAKKTRKSASALKKAVRKVGKGSDGWLASPPFHSSFLKATRLRAGSWPGCAIRIVVSSSLPQDTDPPAAVDSLAARTLVKAEALAPPTGRAEDFARPRREVDREQVKGKSPVANVAPDGRWRRGKSLNRDSSKCPRVRPNESCARATSSAGFGTALAGKCSPVQIAQELGRRPGSGQRSEYIAAL
jgi:hypothetical protein